jgi:hypothetical protein
MDSNDTLDGATLNLLKTSNEHSYNSLQLINFIDDYFKSHDCNTLTTQPTTTTRSAFFCYPCIACSTNFYHEQSLHCHLERRTVYIKVFCIKCDVIKTFFNRCKLVYHIYSHKNNLTEPLYKHISIEIVPVEKLTSNKQQPKLNLDNVNITDLTNDDLNNLENFQTKLKLNNLRLYKCLICNALFFTCNDLKEHYQNSKKLYLKSSNQPDLEENDYMDKSTIDLLSTSTLYSHDDEVITRNLYLNNIENKLQVTDKFSISKLKFSSRCSLVANLNFIFNKFNLYSSSTIEDSTMLLICPECGLGFSKDYIDNFRNHLISQCFYSIKNFRIRCMQKNCSFICKSKRLTIDHWTQRHVKLFKYCELCSKKGLKVMFNNSSVFENEEIVDKKNDDDEIVIEKHFNEKHLDSGQNFKQFIKTIYKCECTSSPECTFDTWKFCRKHYMQKLNKSINYINCFICDKNFNFLRYQQHMLTSHKIKKVTFCSQCGHIE